MPGAICCWRGAPDAACVLHVQPFTRRQRLRELWESKQRRGEWPSGFFHPVRASSRPSGLPSSWTLGRLKDGRGGRGFEAVLWRHSAFCRRVQKHRGCPKSEVEACRGGEGAFLTSPCLSFSLSRDGCSNTVYKSSLAKPVLCWRYSGHLTTASFPAKLRGLDPRPPSKKLSKKPQAKRLT